MEVAAPGMVFDIFDFDPARSDGAFHSLLVDPDLLSPGSSFDFSEVLTTGTITVVAEPASLALLFMGGVLLLRHRCRR